MCKAEGEGEAGNDDRSTATTNRNLSGDEASPFKDFVPGEFVVDEAVFQALLHHLHGGTPVAMSAAAEARITPAIAAGFYWWAFTTVRKFVFCSPVSSVE